VISIDGLKVLGGLLNLIAAAVQRQNPMMAAIVDQLADIVGNNLLTMMALLDAGIDMRTATRVLTRYSLGME
jgi:hypothetical protein